MNTQAHNKLGLDQQAEAYADWVAGLGFELDAPADGIWLVIEDTGAQREASLAERVLWKKLMDMRAAIARSVAEVPAAPQAAQTMIDGGTPGPWRVRKRTNDAGEVLDCFVTAPDCQGRAYDADILGDDYDSPELKLADCELIVAAVNAYRATLAATHPAAHRRTTGYIAPKGRYVPPVLFNPYSGEPRDARDIASDPNGILIIPPDAYLAATQPAAQGLDAQRWGVVANHWKKATFKYDRKGDLESFVVSIDLSKQGLGARTMASTFDEALTVLAAQAKQGGAA